MPIGKEELIGVDNKDDDKLSFDEGINDDNDRKEGEKSRKEEKKKKIEVWGNANTMNLTSYFHKKLLTTPYFKSLFEYKTYHEVLELIKNIKYFDPFNDGENSGTPSIAFCLLYKLHTLKLSYKQLNGMLYNKDQSINIRVIAILYCRFCLHPEEMWNYLKDFVSDETTMINLYHKKITMGEFIRGIIFNNKFFGSNCLLPHISAQNLRSIEDSDEMQYAISQAKQMHKRKNYDAYDSTSSNKKKVKRDNKKSNVGQEKEVNKEIKKDFEPAESRFSKPNFSKSTLPVNYTKRYALNKQRKDEEDEDKFVPKKDVLETETIKLTNNKKDLW
ncbi:hypothetical protein ABK040_007866 [Willaertia magna]